MSEQCYFCGESDALDRHHIVPRRHGGSDKKQNIVTVCPTCHRKLEQLYDNRFYDKIRSDSGLDVPSWWKEPVNNKNIPWTYGKWYVWICENEQQIRKIGPLRWPTFEQCAIEDERPIPEKAAKHIFQRLKSVGAVYQDVRKKDGVDVYKTNRVWYDNINVPPEADPDTVAIMEWVRDD